MKNGLIIAGIAILVVIGAGMALAYSPRWGAGHGMMWGGDGTGNGTWARGAYHDRMEQVLENGTYDDLVALREETGRQMMPWVQDEQIFEQLQEHHKQMEELYGEGAGMMGGRGPRAGRAGGCPMWSD